MVFSKSTEYALRAMVRLALQPPGKLTGAREIAEAENIPMPFLWKILQMLARRRLIRSFKGLRGGYELAHPAEKIRIGDVVLSTDGEQTTDNCVLGLPHCSDENPCPLHPMWKDIKARMAAMIEQTTLADLAQVARQRTVKKKKF
jgi:Rrf2 family protein